MENDGRDINCEAGTIASKWLVTSYLLASDKHAIDLGDGHVGGNTGLVVHVAVALALAGIVGCHFARQNVPKQGESIVQSLSAKDERESASVRFQESKHG